MSLTGKGYDGYGEKAAIETIGLRSERCKPDYQKMAAALKVRIDSCIDLRNALLKSIEFGGLPDGIKSNDFNIYELNGVLDLHTRSLDREYNRLLEEIEKERADGDRS